MKMHDEIILSITEDLEECDNNLFREIVKNPHLCLKYFEGVCIQTNKRLIYFLIYNGQQCCEEWGYLSSPDNIKDFIGLKVENISGVGSPSEGFKKHTILHKYECNEFAILQIETDKGTLEWAVYNSHNGYYSHKVIVIIGDIIKEDCL